MRRVQGVPPRMKRTNCEAGLFADQVDTFSWRDLFSPALPKKRGALGESQAPTAVFSVLKE